MAKKLPRCPDCGGLMDAKALMGKADAMKTCRDCGRVVVGDVPDTPTAPANVPLHKQIATPDPGGWDKFVSPDFHEVMIGWRAWGVKADLADGEFPFLWSVTHRTQKWVPGKAVEAECTRSGARHGAGEDEIPVKDCTCGLYSAKTREHLQSMSYHVYDAERQGMYSVIGEVNVWGKVIEGSQGWRSQFGYPRQLFVPFEAWFLAEALQEAYQVPVRLQNILDDQQKVERVI